MSITDDMPTEMLMARIPKARQLRDEAPAGSLERYSLEQHVKSLEDELDKRERRFEYNLLMET